MKKKFKVGNKEYEINHYQHNDRQYIISLNGERIGTYDNYEELYEAVNELQGNKIENNIYLNGIFGLVVGDALGVPVEFKDRESLKDNAVVDMREYGTYKQPKGTWSDDSSMTLATLSSLIESNGFNPVDMMDRFVSWIRNAEYTAGDYVFDVGTTTDLAIARYIRSKDIYSCGLSDIKNNGNGSLMRILPLCIYLSKKNDISVKDKIDMINITSGLTHNHPISKIACGIYYFFVEGIINNKKLSKENISITSMSKAKYYYRDKEYFEIFSRLNNIMSFKALKEDEIKSSGYVLDSLEAAIWCFLNTDNYKDCVLKAVNLGYDTDTIGAIAGGLAGLYYGFKDIPNNWIDVIMKKEWIEDLCLKANKL